jgi:ferredoxin
MLWMGSFEKEAARGSGGCPTCVCTIESGVKAEEALWRERRADVCDAHRAAARP